MTTRGRRGGAQVICLPEDHGHVALRRGLVPVTDFPATLPDLSPLNLSAPGAIGTGQTLMADYSIENRGTTPQRPL